MRRFYFKIAAIFSVTLILFGITVALITTRASTDVVKEAIQTTNKDLGPLLAGEFQPMLLTEFDQQKIEEKLTELSGKNPQFDFYLLNSEGKIKSVVPASGELAVLSNSVIDTRPLDDFINGSPLPILSDDPLNPGQKKTFSAANISIMGSEGCYLYVVLESDQFSKATAMISDSYITRGTLLVIGLILTISLAVGLFLFSSLSRRLEKMKDTVKKFERGQLSERMNPEGNDELTDLAGCFNKMADTMIDNMKEIEKSDKMRRDLIANVSHDLRSPLASIQGYLETIEMKGDSISKVELQSYLTTVLGNTQKLNRLIDDLFEFTKLDTDQVRPRIEPISMAELVQDLVQQFRPIADKKGVQIEAVFPGNPNSLIEADISMLNRALTNLIDNAIRHTPKGGNVTVSSIMNGEDIVLEVSDTGPGIPASDLPHIFERFYQADKSRPEKSGAGLGLAIARKIFSLHGGDITVSSISNRGTTFTVHLPAHS
jgi:signal transduction histidine kinase